MYPLKIRQPVLSATGGLACLKNRKSDLVLKVTVPGALFGRTASGWGDPNAAHEPSAQPNGPAGWGGGPRKEMPSGGTGAWPASAPPPPPRHSNPSTKVHCCMFATAAAIYKTAALSTQR